MWLVASKIDAAKADTINMLTQRLVAYLRSQLETEESSINHASSSGPTTMSIYESMTHNFKVHFVSSLTFEGIHKLTQALLSVFPEHPDPENKTPLSLSRSTLVTQTFPKSYVVLERTMTSLKESKVLLPYEDFCTRVSGMHV